ADLRAQPDRSQGVHAAQAPQPADLRRPWRCREYRDDLALQAVCNPQLAHAALEDEPELGVLLPCNVVVYQQQGQTHIAAVDAERMLSIVDNDQLASTASEIRQRLAAVVKRAAQS
ncbi:MAG: DUF302 domain-containing protein, partial [Solirubrobacteraceae bacterium]